MIDTDSGCYRLLIELGRDCRIRIGGKGSVSFKKGTYIYTGRSKRNLQKRIERHCRREKKLHWHIDYFLRKGRISEIFLFPGRLDECRINGMIFEEYPNASYVKGFGSSDCRCPGHLIRISGCVQI
jgi:Uri superfamily endonuclease